MATKANLVIDQGATYTTTINLVDGNGDPLDLTGYTGASQMRKSFTSSNSVSFSVTPGGANGTITLALTANATANIAGGRYLYDVELTDAGGKVSRVLEGIVTINPNITR